MFNNYISFEPQSHSMRLGRKSLSSPSINDKLDWIHPWFLSSLRIFPRLTHLEGYILSSLVFKVATFIRMPYLEPLLYPLLHSHSTFLSFVFFYAINASNIGFKTFYCFLTCLNVYISAELKFPWGHNLTHLASILVPIFSRYYASSWRYRKSMVSALLELNI